VKVCRNKYKYRRSWRRNPNNKMEENNNEQNYVQRKKYKNIQRRQTDRSTEISGK